MLLASLAALAVAAAPAPTALRDELRQRGVLLDERRARLAEEEVEALRDGLLALPAKYRRVPFGPLHVQVNPEPGPFGMGDGTGHRPLWTDGRRTFHLYAWEEPNEERALFRAERLSAAERRALWRQRAMVHAVVQRLDDVHRFSRREEYRFVAGWLLPGDRPLARAERPLNMYAWAYSRSLGQRSASLDFVTFAEEALVPPARVSAERAEPLDDTVGCQEFTRLRVLKGAFAELRAGLEGTALGEPARCELFEAFSNPDALEHIELLLSAPSSASPESIFGHLLIRPVFKADSFAQAPSFEPVMEIGAFLGLETSPARYVWRGLTGGSATFFGFNSMAQVIKRSLETEQRSLTRYKLHLSRDELRRVMERMWELERRGYFPYYFFTENCASWVQFLLDGALAPERRIGRVGTLWVMPLATLDRTADRTAGDGQPLLEPLPLGYQPSGTTALDAEVEAAEMMAEVAKASPGVDWEALDEQRRDLDPKVRRAAYQRLGPLLASAPAERAQRLTRALMRIERYAADTAGAKEQKVKDNARVTEGALHRIPSGEELLLARQRRFQRERPFERLAEESSVMLQLRTLADSLPLRELTPSEQRQLDEAVAVREAFSAAALLHAGVASPAQNRAFEDAERSGKEQTARDALRRSLQRSGAYRFGLGVGALRTGAGEVKPSAFVQAALVSEQLGDARTIGFSPEYEIRLLDARALVGVERSRPGLFWGDLDIFQFRALGRRPELGRQEFHHHLGWSVGLSYAHRRVGPVDGDGLHRLLVEGTLFARTLRSVDFSRHLSLGIGGLLEAPVAPGSLNSGLRSQLLARLPLPGHRANALRAELTFSTRFGLLGPEQRAFLHEGSAALELPLFLGRPGETGLLVRPRAELYGRTSFGQLTLTGFALASAEWD